ncbi:MAG: LacI family DNA-binding transcriptional regulator, partial [Spirochaetaceae bacterium]|nr:LacI family DNA-binding transcriptional regulator [Spirochaetaceae bacterium]
EMILRGEIKPGDKIPSENELAAQFGTTRMTVRRALGELEARQIIKRVPGVGTFVDNVNLLSNKKVGVIVHNKRILFGIISALTVENIKYFVFDQKGDVDSEKDSISLLLKYGIDGLIMEPYTISAADELLTRLIIEGFPVVFVDRTRPGDFTTPTVMSDNYKGGYLIGKHIVEHGIKKLVFVTYEGLSILSVKERYEGLSEAIGYKPEMFRFSSLEADFSDLVAYVKKNRVEAVFFCNDVLALRGTCYFLRNGIRVPEDIKVFGYDDESFSRLMSPSLTTIRQDLEKIGQEAVYTLIKILKKEEVDSLKKVDVELIVRESCGCK